MADVEEHRGKRPPYDGDNTNNYHPGAPIDDRRPVPPGVTTTLIDERYHPAPGEVIRIKVIAVPVTDRFPEGVKYAFHYGRTDGETTYLRYDNAHGNHEKHVGERTEELESFPGIRALLRRFRAEVEGARSGPGFDHESR